MDTVFIVGWYAKDKLVIQFSAFKENQHILCSAIITFNIVGNGMVEVGANEGFNLFVVTLLA